VTAEQFRRLALSFPEAFESSHMQHPDFRVRGGKPLATWAVTTAWLVAWFAARRAFPAALALIYS
jgi:hypothetical protein